MRAELLETAKSLPSTFHKILESLNNETVLRAIEYYANFVRDAHTEKEVCTMYAFVLLYVKICQLLAVC